MTTPLLELRDLRKRYNIGQPNEAEVLRGVSLTLQAIAYGTATWLALGTRRR